MFKVSAEDLPTRRQLLLNTSVTRLNIWAEYCRIQLQLAHLCQHATTCTLENLRLKATVWLCLNPLVLRLSYSSFAFYQVKRRRGLSAGCWRQCSLSGVLSSLNENKLVVLNICSRYLQVKLPEPPERVNMEDAPHIEPEAWEMCSMIQSGRFKSHFNRPEIWKMMLIIFE